MKSTKFSPANNLSKAEIDRKWWEIGDFFRRNSLWMLMYCTGCCAIELPPAMTSAYDMERLGMGPMATPRQADILLVSGYLSLKTLRRLIYTYEQMSEPRYVVALGSCPINGGIYHDSHAVINQLDQYIPVDVYVAGCMPNTESVMNGFVDLMGQIKHKKANGWKKYHENFDWYKANQLNSLGRWTSMTNSMNNVDYVQSLIKNHVNPLQVEIIDQYQVAFVVNQNEVLLLLSTLKNAGWLQMSYLSAIDWPEENKFEVVYILFNWDTPVYVQIRTKIDRTNPELASIIQIYPGAKYYERECHEFFGIAFPGNPDYEKQLILEQWDDIPPLRKDFDPKAYSDRKFPQRTYTDNYEVTNNEPSKQKKREQRKLRAESLKGGKKQ